MEQTVIINPLVSEYTMRNMRERLDLDEYDTSRDEEILSMSPLSFLNELLEWEGFIGYTGKIIDMIYEAYGIDLDCIEADYQRKIVD